MCHSSLNLTLKTALNLLNFDEVADKNKLAPFLWLTMYVLHKFKSIEVHLVCFVTVITIT